jgi:D-beta-D-heptose 7-phosphate kinase / D-beta-D-heptose 1-phosphate adenosyltransferase
MNDLNDRLQRTKLAVLGDVILDSYIMGEVTRISPEAPVPIVKVKKRATSLGGAGNVALNLRGLGCAVSLLSVRGPDESGECVSRVLKGKEIKDCLLIDHDHTTTTKTRILGQNQQLIRLDEEVTWKDTENYRDELMARLRAELSDANAVILSDYHKGVLNGALTQATIQECKKRGVPVFVDPKRKNWERYLGAMCITPNIPELEEIYGRSVASECLNPICWKPFAPLKKTLRSTGSWRHAGRKGCVSSGRMTSRFLSAQRRRKCTTFPAQGIR